MREGLLVKDRFENSVFGRTRRGLVPIATVTPLFTLPTITSANYKQWCEARLLTGLSNNDPVASFTDQSGLANHWTQSTSGAKPLYKTNVINGLPALEFDGSDDCLTLGSNILSGATSGEVWILLAIDTDPPGASAQSGLWNMDGETINTCHYPFTDGTLYEAWGSTARKSTGVNPTPSLTGWRLYNVGSAASDYRIRLDGTEIYNTATNTFSGFTDGTIYLGRSAGLFGDIFLDGKIAAIVITDAVVNTTDRGTINDHFESVYGLTIA